MLKGLKKMVSNRVAQRFESGLFLRRLDFVQTENYMLHQKF